jgi:8-oxo-dGTP pyrophosphatase MutT (NUDIX family)
MAENGAVIYITYKDTLLVGNENMFISNFFKKPYDGYIPPVNNLDRDRANVLYDGHYDLLAKFFSYARNGKRFSDFARDASSVFIRNIEPYRIGLIKLLESNMISSEQNILLQYLKNKNRITLGEMIFKDNPRSFHTKYTKYYACGDNTIPALIDSTINLVIIKPLIIRLNSSISTPKGSIDKLKDMSLLACAQRELCEEIGIRIDAISKLVDTDRSITLDRHIGYNLPRIYRRFNWNLTDSEYSVILMLIREKNQYPIAELFNLRFINPYTSIAERPFFYDFINGQIDLPPIPLPVVTRVPAASPPAILSPVIVAQPPVLAAQPPVSRPEHKSKHDKWLKGGSISKHILYTKNKEAYNNLVNK